MLDAQTQAEIGDASISSVSMNGKLKLRGQHIPLKQNDMGDTFTLESSRGKLAWEVDQMTGKLSDLKDEGGRKVAKYNGGDLPGMGERSLDVCVPCDQELFELILLSVMAARALNKQNIKVGLKVFRMAMGA